MGNTVLETERLRLRRLVPEDLEALGRILDDPDVMRYFGTKARQLEVTRECMAHYDVQGFGMLAAEYKATGACIGRVGFIRQHVEGADEVEIGWLVAREQWGKGLATEAARALIDYGFTWLGLPRLISLIDPENAASLAVARKLGAICERDVAMFEKPVIHLYTHTRRDTS